jgi:hypothetical protein
MKKVLVIFLLLIYKGVNAQENFQRLYSALDSDELSSTIRTKDGGYFLIGSTWSSGAGGNDILLTYTDSVGNFKWAKTYGTIDEEIGNYIIRNINDSYTIMANYQSLGEMRILLLNIDSLGNQNWSKVYNGIGFASNYNKQRGFSNTSDGGIVVTGTNSSSSFDNDIFLFKTDINGNLQWSKTFEANNGNVDVGASVISTIDGNIILTGTFNGIGGNDIFLSKFDNSGNMIWARNFSGYSDDWANYVYENNKEEIVVVGGTRSFTLSDDIFLLNTDKNGDLLKFKVFKGSSTEEASFVSQLSDGGYVLTGYSYSFGLGVPSFPNAYLLKLDSGLNFMWYKAFGGVFEDYGMSVIETSNKDLVLTGMTNSFSASNYDIYMLKTDSLGNNDCIQFSGNVQSITTSITQNTPTFNLINAGYDSTIVLKDSVFFFNYSAICVLGSIDNKQDFNNNQVSLSPNPFSEYTTIYFDNIEHENLTLQLYNNKGQLVIEENIKVKENDFNYILNRENLIAGLYLLKISNKDTLVFSNKILITN